MKTVFLSFSIICLASSWGSAQRIEKQKITSLETEQAAIRQKKLALQRDSAILFSQQGKYHKAEKMFVSLFEKMASIPSNIVYYFGVNSFFLKKYKQSIDWLNKYIELKGTGNDLSEQALKYLKKAEQEALKGRQKNKGAKGKDEFIQHIGIPCGKHDKLICPVCHGATVIVTKNYIKDNYKTCTYCHGRGYLDCEEYNKMINKQLIINTLNNNK